MPDPDPDDAWKGEDKLRGIRASRREGAGHNFGKSGLSKRLLGKSDNAPPEIYRQNMPGDDNA